MGKLRTSDEAFHQAWLPYMRKVGQIIAANQITRGGVCKQLPPVVRVRFANLKRVARYTLTGRKRTPRDHS